MSFRTILYTIRESFDIFRLKHFDDVKVDSLVRWFNKSLNLTFQSTETDVELNHRDFTPFRYLCYLFICCVRV